LSCVAFFSVNASLKDKSACSCVRIIDEALSACEMITTNAVNVGAYFVYSVLSEYAHIVILCMHVELIITLLQRIYSILSCAFIAV